MNFQKETENILSSLGAETPRLLLHACCAPCASYVLEYLSDYFEITVLYMNPNIHPAEEYFKRLGELEKLVSVLEAKHPVTLITREYEPERFSCAVGGLEGEPEGGKRCGVCFALRLEEAAKAAKDGDFDYFATTLTVGPRKDAELINAIGGALREKDGVRWLPADFKKRGGYQRSIELCKKYGIYRQNYCGCLFSRGN